MQVAHQCSFVEPFVGMGGGYVQVTRATGTGPVLLLLPLEGTEFEAWRPMRHGEDNMRLDFMFEASYEVWLGVDLVASSARAASSRCLCLCLCLCFCCSLSAFADPTTSTRDSSAAQLVLHSAAYARGEWRDASPWNPATSATLQSGETRRYGVRMVLAPSLSQVEATLLLHGIPVAQPLPTPVVHADMAAAALLVSLPRSISAARITPADIEVSPSSALTITSCTPAGLAEGAASRVRCALAPQRPPADGRVRLTIPLEATDAGKDVAEAKKSGGTQAQAGKPRRMTVHLFVAESAATLVKLHGKHGAEKAWMSAGTPDPWHRDGAFFGWDDATSTAVVQERRGDHAAAHTLEIALPRVRAACAVLPSCSDQSAVHTPAVRPPPLSRTSLHERLIRRGGCRRRPRHGHQAGWLA